MSALAEYDRRVDKGTKTMAMSMKMFNDGKREVVSAQQKVLADIKSIFENSKPAEAVVSPRDQRAKRRSSVSVAFFCSHFVVPVIFLHPVTILFYVIFIKHLFMLQ